MTASIKGRSDGFTIKGGDATKGTLATMYDGPRPNGGYQPSKKQVRMHRAGIGLLCSRVNYVLEHVSA